MPGQLVVPAGGDVVPHEIWSAIPGTAQHLMPANPGELYKADLVTGNGVLLNRRSAFDVFDVEHSGTITAFEVPNALMGCDDVRQAFSHGTVTKDHLREAEVQAAMDRVDVQPGGIVTFQEFNSICDVLVHSMEGRQRAEEQRAMERAAAEEDEVYFAKVGAPESPRGPRALIGDPESYGDLGPIQRSFYAFDIDQSGTVSGHEVPRMLRLAGIGPKTNDQNTWDRYQNKWVDALASIYPPREPSDLLNVNDFHDMCILLNPSLPRELPERPRPPSPVNVDELSPEELARLEAERLAEERRLAEEAEAARIAEELRKRRCTLHVRLMDSGGRIVLVPEVTPVDKVSTVADKLQEMEGIPVDQQRLIGQGWEMNHNFILDNYNLRIGDPMLDKADIVTLLIRAPYSPSKQERAPLGTLTIRSQRGEVWQITVREEDAVGDLMARLQDLTGVPAGQQRLIGNGRELSPFERLREAGVILGDTIVLLER